MTGVLITCSQDFLLEEVATNLEEYEYLLDLQHLEIAGLRESQ